MKVNVVRNHQVEEPIVVVIAEGSAGGIATIRNARLRGDFGKGAISVVSIQHIAAETRDVKIRPAVIVVVADGAPIRKAGRGNAGFLGDVSKRTVEIVVVGGAASLF